MGPKIPDPSRWMNRSPGYDCLICGARANHDAALMAVYMTRLCLDHSNEFHEYVLKRGWVRKLNRLKQVRDANVIAYRGKVLQLEAIESATKAVDMYKDKLYYECKRWEGEKIAEFAKARDEAAKFEGQP